METVSKTEKKDLNKISSIPSMPVGMELVKIYAFFQYGSHWIRKRTPAKRYEWNATIAS